MFAYRTPGVSFEPPLARPEIAALRTDIAGFVGLAARGPLHQPVEVGSFEEFAAVFGRHLPQAYLAYAVEGFFANGGRRAWVVRAADPSTARAAILDLAEAGGTVHWQLAASSPGLWGEAVRVTAIANDRGRFTLLLRTNSVQETWRDLALGADDERSVAAVLNGDGGSRLLRVCPAATFQPSEGRLEVVPGRVTTAWPRGGADGLATLRPEHLAGRGAVFDPVNPCSGTARTDAPWGVTALETVDAVSLVAMPDLHPKPLDPAVFKARPVRCGSLPEDDIFPGEEPPPPRSESEPPEHPPTFSGEEVLLLEHALVAHCEKLRERVALLDVPRDHTTPERALAWRRSFRSRFAALYFPWLRVRDPLRLGGRLVREVPASGHVAGLAARVDRVTGVHKPPAGEVLRAAEDVAFALADVDHGELNDSGVNAIRVFPGRGLRVAGGRTTAPRDEPEWRYLNVRRLIILIEESIDEGTQWSVFENNDPRLWQQIERTVTGLLERLWRAGRLDGASREEAFFARCDETTNSPAQTAAGRAICLVGVRPPWPAEFVVVKIGIGENGAGILEEGVNDG